MWHKSYSTLNPQPSTLNPPVSFATTTISVIQEDIRARLAADQVLTKPVAPRMLAELLAAGGPALANAVAAERANGAKPTATAAANGTPGESFEPDRWLHHGDTVTLGDLTLDVIHCPGHTPGHVVFHAPQIDRAFVGDVLFAGSIGRTDFPRGDHRALQADPLPRK